MSDAPVVEDLRPRWPGPVTLVAVGAVLLGSIAGGILAVLGDRLSTAAGLLGGGAGQYGVLWLTCRWASRRYARAMS